MDSDYLEIDKEEFKEEALEAEEPEEAEEAEEAEEESEAEAEAETEAEAEEIEEAEPTEPLSSGIFDEENVLEHELSDEDSMDEDLETSTKTSKINSNFDKKTNNIIFRNNNLEEEDSPEFLQKFDSDNKKDYIICNHNECLNKNFNEIKNLLVVKKNSNNIIIDEFHKTIPILTKYEKTKIIGIRVKQLNNGSKPFINVSENIIDSFIIANKELSLKKLPFIIERPMPNNISEYWKLEDLEIL